MSRKDPKIRKNEILVGAVKFSEKIGYKALTRANLSDELKISDGLITHYFGSMDALRQALLKLAIKEENLVILSQAIALKDPAIKKISKELKTRAVNFLIM